VDENVSLVAVVALVALVAVVTHVAGALFGLDPEKFRNML